MEPQPSAPPVVAVVVANEPGDWFEEALVALGSQDYPNQSVLVMDAGGDADSARRVASVLPDAYLRRVPTRPGFAAAANDVLQTVQGASFLVFCHDDVAMEPDAIRLLVEEALRSNAGIVAPKVVEWDHPDRLLEVGLVVDKTGACASVVDRGELDQEQHDAVKDVFAVSNTCLLVRSDLFSELGGFDAEMGDHGADVDLCWRAQVAGARVVVAPAARVRHHTGDDRHREDAVDKDAAQSRHHLRTMFKSYSLLHLLRVVPQAMVVTLVETVVALFARRWGEARQLVAAWFWNLRQLNRLRPLRKAVHRSRNVPDSEVRRLQVRGSVRLTNYLQRRLHAEERARALVSAGQELVDVGVAGAGPGRGRPARPGRPGPAHRQPGAAHRPHPGGRPAGALPPAVHPAHPLRRRLAHHRPGLAVVGPAHARAPRLRRHRSCWAASGCSRSCWSWGRGRSPPSAPGGSAATWAHPWPGWWA